MFGLPADPTCCLLRLDGQANTEASAIFGEANYDFTDKLNVVVGGRYSRERRSGRNDVEFVNFLTPLFDNQTPFEPATFTSFTPKVGLNYQLSDAVFAYASASRGFKSGGFNIGSYQNTPFNPEKIWSYEAGVKTDLLDRRLRLNLAAFYYDYTDLQVQDVEGNNTVVRNAATAVIQGLELETTALLGTAVQLDLAATYLDSEFRDSCLADPKHPLPQPRAGLHRAQPAQPGRLAAAARAGAQAVGGRAVHARSGEQRPAHPARRLLASVAHLFQRLRGRRNCRRRAMAG